MCDYFDAFPEFEEDINASLLDEFHRLANSRHWKARGIRFNKEMSRCLQAGMRMLLDEDSYDTRLEALQAFCVDLGIKRFPPSITQCKKAISSVHANIFDLIDARRRGHRLPRFPSRAALRKYCERTKKWFPKEIAKEELGWLLCEFYWRSSDALLKFDYG